MTTSRKVVFVLLAFSLLAMGILLSPLGDSQAEAQDSGGTPEPSQETTPIDPEVVRIGAVHPLTGDGAVYGLPVQRVIERAVRDLNEEWAEQDRRLEVVFADGQCTAADALAAARRLVEEDGVRVIYGGTCSGEVLGMAPYVETNRVLLLSPLASSDEITGAGDYIFRNTPTNSAQVDAMLAFLGSEDYRRFALLTADTAYAQDLRRSYVAGMPGIGGTVVADEVVGADEVTDLAAAVGRIAAAQPDAVIVLPQTIPGATRFTAALHTAGVTAQGIGSDVVGVAGDESTRGYYVPVGTFKGEGTAEFLALQDETDCDLSYYCATTYDGIFLLGEALARCGDDTSCLRGFLYGTQGWDGKFYGSLSFDAHGDIATAGAFRIDRVAEVVRIGAVHPLTGDGAVYGLPVQRVIERAVRDLNEEWAEQDRRLEVVFADGQCTAADALAAARRLVEEDGVRVIYGGTCSGEVLGMAPYVETNRVLLLSPLASSDEITGAGDYIFRNTPTNSAQVDAMLAFLGSEDYRRFALLTADTAYAQDLRRSYVAGMPGIGGTVVADEVVGADEVTDLAAAVGRIAAAQPDAVIVLPQTIPGATRFTAALHTAGVTAQGIGSDVVGVADDESTRGYYVPVGTFKGEGTAEFLALQDETDCDLSYYCATTYDGIFLLGEALARCGDDTSCLRGFLYGTQGWDGKFYGSLSFDAHGDIATAGAFRIDRVADAAAVAAN